MSKHILTTFDVAAYAKVTMPTVINWIEDGSLKAYKTKGGHRRVKKEDLWDFLRKHNIPFAEKQRILIVDDEYAIRDGLKDLCEDAGYAADTAANGFEAGALLEQTKPDVIILDIIMPGLDGFSVCRYIKGKENLQHTKIIILTGYLSAENEKKARDLGVDLCLAKPIKGEDLIKAIQSLIDTQAGALS